MLTKAQVEEIRGLKNGYVSAKLDGMETLSRLYMDWIYEWYVDNMQNLTNIQCKEFGIFFHMNDYL